MTTTQNMKVYDEFAKSGVVTKLHIGRSRCNSRISKIKDTEDMDFVTLGNVKFLPASMDKKLSSLENNLRQYRNKLSLNGDFMLLADFKKFKEFFDEQRQEYFLLRDQIYDNWENIVSAYTKNLQKASEKLDVANITVPNREYFKNSFYMELEVGLLPTINPDNVSDTLREVTKELSESNKIGQERFLKEVQGKMLSEIVEDLSTIYNVEGRLHGKTLNNIQGNVKRISERNFSEAVSEALTLLENVLKGEAESRKESVEYALAKIYGLASSKNLNAFVNWKSSVVSVDILKELSEILSAA